MNIRKLFDKIRSADSFNAFWTYPEEKNLSVLEGKLSYIKSARELRSAVVQICSQAFEENDEGSFLYTEAQNLLRHTESVVEKAVSIINPSGAYAEAVSLKEEKEKNRFAMWEESVRNKLCQLYSESLLEFTKDVSAHEVQEHVKIVLFGEERSDLHAHIAH
ncbi:uncharacterized protein NEMAJ01_1986 [Nematocida major]|uniref:uncharacterized protein n=1 Tax=Nematocida major TaxID=1912982 RepID=UPI002007EDA3|nr:uncharacterized protein NEMAJ01_1986 [Nematocida major]KAH9387090.1 hypothetical protein NEMAJ01_1986 [Nematocida major]